jgi:hypothetical protein
MELGLCAGDRYLSLLSPEWPAGDPPLWTAGADIHAGDFLTTAEVAAAETALGAVSLLEIADGCAYPERAELALEWLSRTPQELADEVDELGSEREAAAAINKAEADHDAALEI